MESCACGQMYCNGCMKEQPVAGKVSATVPATQEPPAARAEETEAPKA